MKKLLMSLAALFVLFSAVLYSFAIPYSIVTKKTDNIMRLCKENEKSVAAFGDALMNDPELKPDRGHRLIIRDNKVILQTFKKYSGIVSKEKDVSEKYRKYWDSNEWLQEDAEVYVVKFSANEYFEEPGSSIMLKYRFSQKLYHLERILRIYYGDDNAFLETDYYASTGEHSYHYLTDSKKICYDYDTYWFD